MNENSKTVPNKDIIVTTEDAVKDIEKVETGIIGKITSQIMNAKLQNNYNLIYQLQFYQLAKEDLLLS